MGSQFLAKGLRLFSSHSCDCLLSCCTVVRGEFANSVQPEKLEPGNISVAFLRVQQLKLFENLEHFTVITV